MCIITKVAYREGRSGGLRLYGLRSIIHGHYAPNLPQHSCSTFDTQIGPWKWPEGNGRNRQMKNRNLFIPRIRNISLELRVKKNFSITLKMCSCLLGYPRCYMESLLQIATPGLFPYQRLIYTTNIIIACSTGFCYAAVNGIVFFPIHLSETQKAYENLRNFEGAYSFLKWDLWANMFQILSLLRASIAGRYG